MNHFKVVLADASSEILCIVTFSPYRNDYYINSAC